MGQTDPTPSPPPPPPPPFSAYFGFKPLPKNQVILYNLRKAEMLRL